MVTPRKHRHAKLIKQWIEDDSLELECKDNGVGPWYVIRRPSWGEHNEYRFKPKMIRCGDIEFPEPMRVAPEIGTTYWTADIRARRDERVMADEWTWSNDKQDMLWLEAGICHLTSDAAEAHASALLSLTEIKSYIVAKE